MTTQMELRTREAGSWGLNAYVFICPTTRQSILIDPGADPEALLELVQGTAPVAILVTHTHADHIGALAAMQARLKAPVMFHAGPHVAGFQFSPDRELHDGDIVAVGEHHLLVQHAPGHTADQICVAPEEDVNRIVGDTVFEGGPGKTWSADDFQTTLRTLRNVVLEWPDDTVCHPGHGPAFRLGDRRRQIEAFIARNHGAFFGDATWEM
jgi:hydroxyacylglutathione hydrolase